MKVLVVLSEESGFDRVFRNIVVEVNDFRPDQNDWVESVSMELAQRHDVDRGFFPVSFVPLDSYLLSNRQWMVSAWYSHRERNDHYFGLIRIDEHDPTVTSWEDLIELFQRAFSGQQSAKDMGILSFYPVGNVKPGDEMPILVSLKRHSHDGFSWETIQTALLVLPPEEDNPNFMPFRMIGMDPYSPAPWTIGAVPVTTIPLGSFQEIHAKRLIFGICFSYGSPDIHIGYLGSDVESGIATVTVPMLNSVLKAVSERTQAQTTGVWCVYPVF